MAVKSKRPGVLDNVKQSEILAIVSVGCSRSAAAKYVGCAPSTIRRTAARDAKFARGLRLAMCNAEVGLLRNIRNAAKKEQYWRAAAWALEHGFPEKYARRGPDVITVEQISRLLGQLTDIIVEEVPVARYRKSILQRLESLSRSIAAPRKDPSPRGRP